MFSQDIRFGLRILAKNPGSTIAAALILALALGVNTAIFSVLDVALLKPLPVRNPGGLVMLTNPNASMILGGMLTGERSLLTYAEFSQLREHATTMSGLCASQVTMERWPIRIAGSAPEEVRGRLVSEDYFSTLGVHPAMGRVFTQTDATGAGKDPYAVISYDYWQRRFGGNTAVIGKPIRLYRTTFVIVGVAAKGFRGETVGQEPGLWVPLLMQPLILPGFDGLHDTLSGTRDKLMWLHVFGRRKAGVTLAQVRAEVNVLFRGILDVDYPVTMQPQERKEALNQYIAVWPMRTGAFHGRNEFSEQWLLLSALAALVLFVACANVANLLLARASGRSREVAIRLSIGAGRGRLVRQFLTESLLLAVLSGIAGLFVAEAALHILPRILSAANDGFALPAGIDLRVLAFAACATLLTGTLFGLTPALRASGGEAGEQLKDAGRGTTRSRKRAMFAKALVAAQLALSLLLGIGAGLFVRTLWNLESVALGYPRKDLLLVNLDSSHAGYRDVDSGKLYRALATRIREIPGVRGVSYSDRGLFSGFEGAFPIEAEGFTSGKEEDRGSTGDSVGAGYFSTIGIPILLGREIAPRDAVGGAPVCVINEAFAKHFFAGRNPIGQHVTVGPQRLEVIGVAGNARVQSLRGKIDPKIYFAGGGPWFEIRTTADPGSMLRAVRHTILGFDGDLSVERATTLNDAVDAQNAQPRFIAQLSATFGILGLVLAGIGVYALVSYGVASRKNEIGIRMALGADGNRVIRMILKETGAMIAAGAAAGIAASGAGARLMAAQLYGLDREGPRWSLASYEHVENATQLFGLRATDPVTIGASMGVLCGLALVAALIPATRAARMDPVPALRQE